MIDRTACNNRLSSELTTVIVMYDIRSGEKSSQNSDINGNSSKNMIFVLNIQIINRLIYLRTL